MEEKHDRIILLANVSRPQIQIVVNTPSMRKYMRVLLYRYQVLFSTTNCSRAVCKMPRDEKHKSIIIFFK